MTEESGEMVTANPCAQARALIERVKDRRGVLGARVGCIGYEEDLIAHLAAALEREEEQDASFELRWNADMRAIKMWQEAHPGNDLVWPDHADLCVWLLEELDKYKQSLAMSVGDELDRSARREESKP